MKTVCKNQNKTQKKPNTKKKKLKEKGVRTSIKV